MSTGIGNHEWVEGTGESAYDPPKAHCPYCNSVCEADFVDVGLGLVQCGPYYCGNCGASEASSRDSRARTPKEEETGWYLPGTPVSETANTVNGELVDHHTAKEYYDLGFLDRARDQG